MPVHPRRKENKIKEAVLLGYQRMYPQHKAFKVSWTERYGFRVFNLTNKIISQFTEKGAVKYLDFNKKFMKAGDVPTGAYYQVEGQEKIFIKNRTINKDFTNESFIAAHGTCMCRVLTTAEKNAITYAPNGWTS